jgi:hypothetical protein
MSAPFVVAGGIVRNRAWVLPRHLSAVRANVPALMFYLTGDNTDDTVEILDADGEDMNVSGFHLVHNVGNLNFTRDGSEGEGRYSSAIMADLRNRWAAEALKRWPQLTHLFVVDSDVLPEPDVLERLLAVDQPIVGAWVPGCPPQPELDGAEYILKLFIATCLGGCYLIRRDALDAGIEWRQHAQSEDGGLAESARGLGFMLWADPDAKCTHIMERDQ